MVSLAFSWLQRLMVGIDENESQSVESVTASANQQAACRHNHLISPKLSPALLNSTTLSSSIGTPKNTLKAVAKVVFCDGSTIGPNCSC
jgi:hypothetical protein